MPFIQLKEFGCGLSVRTGTQIISWIILFSSFVILYEINYYYYITKSKKVGYMESPLTLLIFNSIFGIGTSLSALYGAYHNIRLWLKPLIVFFICQFFVIAIIIYIYFMLIYPSSGQTTNPRKTRFVILNTIMGIALATGLFSYALLTLYTYFREISDSIDGREYLLPGEDHHQVLLNDDNFPSNMTSVSSHTTRSYLTTTRVDERGRFLNNFCPPPPAVIKESPIPDSGGSYGIASS